MNIIMMIGCQDSQGLRGRGVGMRMPCLSLSLSEMRKLLIGIANQVGQFSVDCAWYYIFSFSLRILPGRIDRT